MRQLSRRFGGVTGPYKASFQVNATVNAKVNAPIVRATSQGDPISWRGPALDRQLLGRNGMSVCSAPIREVRSFRGLRS